MSLEITAMLSKVIYVSERSSFMVAEFVDCQSAKRFKATSETLRLGKNEGQQRYRIFGEWRNNPRYGDTFAIAYAEPLKPQTLGGLVQFLANNVKGVGEKTAERLVASLELTSMDALVEICREKPEIISNFFGKRSEIATDVIRAIVGDEQYRNIMMFLHDNNIPPHFAKKIYERYGASAVSVLQENPYRLIRDFRNVGFKRADAIAQKLGIPWNSRFRVEAAFVYVLERSQDDGHCCLTRALLLQKAAEVLQSSETKPMDTEWLLGELRQIYKAAQAENQSAPFVVRSLGEPLFYLPPMFDMENRIASYCNERLRKSGIGQEASAKNIPSTEKELAQWIPDIPWQQLSPEQFDAVTASAHENFMILTGGPGCGKTFVLKAIFRLQQALKRSVALCAPTGLAAKRMSQSVGANATTLHKLLGIGRPPAMGSQAASDRTAAAVSEESSGVSIEMVDTVICDESSMLSVDLLLALLESMGPSKRLILVGDVDQLPSVGPGQCLKDLMATQRIKVCRLTKIFRQAGSSPIPIAARQIMSGDKPTFDHRGFDHAIPARKDFAFLGTKSENFFDVLFPFLQETIPSCYDLNPVRDVQILVPMRKSIVGQDEINRRMQETFNPKSESRNEFVARGGQYILREGDKVIQTRNNYDKDVFNGDTGYIQVIRVESGNVEIDVQFQDRTVRLKDEEVEDLQLCYAMTIHKSQGSEFPLCIVPLFSAYYAMLYRNLLYTAVTRASQSVIIIGEEWALTRAVRNMDATKRLTALEALIRQDQV
jgi:exodeoxyribonuclease V alpha subunit